MRDLARIFTAWVGGFLVRIRVCRHPVCAVHVRTRGLCHGHYQNWRAAVRAGTARPEAELLAEGLIGPKGEGTFDAGKLAPMDPYKAAGK